MTPDLLSFLVAPNRSGSAAIQIGVARDLVAARVLARKADEGHPHAKAFVESAQEQMAQAKIRRDRAGRLRAGAARASRFGYHDLARMGCEAAIEEEREAQALDANVIGSVRATHAEAFGGYSSFSPEEEKMLQRKAFEDSQTSSQREDTMNKLLSNLYASSAKMGGEDGYGDDGEDGEDVDGGGNSTADIAAYLHAASVAFGGDLDSVFGADAAERMGAVSRAAMHKVRADLRRKKAHLERLGMEAEETRERHSRLDDLGMDWQEPPERSDFGLDDLGLDDLGLDDLGLDDLGLDDLGLDDLGFDDDDDDEDGMKDLRARAAVQGNDEIPKLTDAKLRIIAQHGETPLKRALAQKAILDREWYTSHRASRLKFGDDLGLDDLGLDDLGLDDLDSLGNAEKREARRDRREQRRQLRLQIKELRRQLKALRHSSEATGDAEDERVGVDVAEDEQFEMALSGSPDFGADEDEESGPGKKKVNAGRIALAIASGGVSEAVRAGAHAAGKPGSAKVVAKLKTLSDKKVRAIMNDGLRTKSVRLAAKAELKRRAAAAEDEGSDEGGSSESGASDLTVKVPGAFTEKSYLDSYKGVAPPRKRFVKFFKDRAAKMGADDAGTIALAVQAPEDDSFGGFFSALGEFFSNIFKVGKKDAGRIKHASKAGRAAAEAKKKDLRVKESREALHTAQLAKLKNRRAAEPDAVEGARLDKQIADLRQQLRTDREAVKKARVAAFDADFSPDSVAKDYDDGKGYIYRKCANGDILIVAGLNRDANKIVPKDSSNPREQKAWKAIMAQIASGEAAPVARVPLADPGSVVFKPAADKIVVNRQAKASSSRRVAVPASGMFQSQADADAARAEAEAGRKARAASETASLLRSSWMPV